MNKDKQHSSRRVIEREARKSNRRKAEFGGRVGVAHPQTEEADARPNQTAAGLWNRIKKSLKRLLGRTRSNRSNMEDF